MPNGQSGWVGKSIGSRYKIKELLGEGGMSAVYEAVDPNLRRTVAVKLIHSYLSHDQEFVQRFEEEAAAVAQLRHPNIIQVFDFDHDGDTYYMVLEHIPGDSLQETLHRLSEEDKQLPFQKVVKIGADIADALAYAHGRGMIHRDVKPANIMLHPNGDAVLMDFGIAKIIGGKLQTATGAIIGTAIYMAPEQGKGAKPTPSIDIYSLGVVLFEMVSGRPPFEGESAITVLMKHANDPVPDIATLNPSTPPQLKAIIERALAKNPEDRFSSAEEMAAALRQVFHSPKPSFAGSYDNTVIESPPEPTILENEPSLDAVAPEPIQGPPRERNTRTIATAAGAITLAVLLIAGIAYVFGRGSKQTAAPPAPTLPLAQPSPTAEILDPSETPFPTLEPPVGSGNIYIEYILDGSGSMLEVLGTKTKLAIAQEVLSERVAALPPAVNVGMRVYGHNVYFEDTEASCEDIELVVPLQPGGSDLIINWLPGMQAQGMTPMSESIRLASEDFTFEPERRNFIVLISDGIETCGEDPAEVVLFLQDLGIDFTIHVIGLNVGPDARTQLQRLASVAEGTYIDANSEGELSAALGQVNETMLEPPPAPEPTATSFPQANYNATSEGTVEASSTYPGFPTSYAIDDDFSTSWFSTGPEPDGTPSSFLWTGQRDDFITNITITSNDFNSEPSFRTGFGFGNVIVQVLDSSGSVVFETSVDLPGTPDPEVVLTPNVSGRSVLLLYSGHESTDCGGFGELQIGVYREGEGS